MMSTELIAYLEKCDANDVLSGKDKNAYLTECIFRNDGGLTLVVNDLVGITVNKIDGYRSVNFKIIRYANNQAIEFFAAELEKDIVRIEELRDRNESNVKRRLIFPLDEPRITITEYT